MKIVKISLSIIAILLGGYLCLTGVASTLNDEPARMAIVTGMYWICWAILLWVTSTTGMNIVIGVGCTVIILQYVILGIEVLLLLQIVLLTVLVIIKHRSNEL
ncbi:hypothetical protein NVV76_10620 [Pediococcus ethanolidurans]|uniref:hypothetical protein n=2 Tax=Pediococcus ethanolidurans TaxID=319653 RepID=UPI001C1F1086|nr:hypothetical protein [Pediococcus ethanolidurans]MBU7555877.1 hypothetical protein [Pediococcus ethanolidurans]MBU7563574.1 hypothetical protein [Pediococcus ethanolidurans]MCT4398083.1 hypothetical protein [Pediococcus ethanolidurans]MCV3322580.1 hypothetical protein [Pediococcus ethanolidurans]MCV3328601.1 hypothetical protein [Pediococcus ethanolidurans]